MQRTDIRERTEIPPGTLYLLILKTLSAGPLHGYGIVQHIKRLSEEVLRVEGLIYRPCNGCS
jgi:DNA-binding PadR family transcriptional regulator